MDITVTFEFEKETKHKLRYTEIGEPHTHRIGTIYLLKSVAAQLGNPRRITITLEAAANLAVAA
ncbi:MAG: hypothetical protein M3P50_06695 [Actinomycetota bacterium]|nr:hypothetical protein [Actinomycetota bacterium]